MICSLILFLGMGNPIELPPSIKKGEKNGFEKSSAIRTIE
jgi:hypothetical protein